MVGTDKAVKLNMPQVSGLFLVLFLNFSSSFLTCIFLTINQFYQVLIIVASWNSPFWRGISKRRTLEILSEDSFSYIFQPYLPLVTASLSSLFLALFLLINHIRPTYPSWAPPASSAVLSYGEASYQDLKPTTLALGAAKMESFPFVR